MTASAQKLTFAVTAALNGSTNPFTHKPHSQRYKDILKKRNDLPVAGKMAEFLEVRPFLLLSLRTQVFQKNQFVVVVGETGSGKTTQIPQYVAYADMAQRSKRRIACTQPRRVAE